MSKSAISVPGFGLSRPDGSPGSLREAVLAGPGARVQAARIGDPIRAVVTPEQIAAAWTAAGHVDKQRATLFGAVTTVLVLGLCLYCGQGSAVVITRLWPLLSVFNGCEYLHETRERRLTDHAAVALRLRVADMRELQTSDPIDDGVSPLF